LPTIHELYGSQNGAVSAQDDRQIGVDLREILLVKEVFVDDFAVFNQMRPQRLGAGNNIGPFAGAHQHRPGTGSAFHRPGGKIGGPKMG
jgi:hypothetical protein